MKTEWRPMVRLIIEGTTAVRCRDCDKLSYHKEDTVEIDLQALYNQYGSYREEVLASSSMPFRTFGDYATDYIANKGKEKRRIGI